LDDSRKYPYIYHRWFFGIPRARAFGFPVQRSPHRGTYYWNSEGTAGSETALPWSPMRLKILH